MKEFKSDIVWNAEKPSNDHFKLVGREVVSCNVHEWAAWFERADRIIKQENVGEARVSTVFLGLDHSFGEGRPLIFETMIFGGPHDQYQERYSTYEEAEAGHARAMALAQGAETPDERI